MGGVCFGDDDGGGAVGEDKNLEDGAEGVVGVPDGGVGGGVGREAGE